MANEFADRLLAWFDTHGRHDLPWQHPRTPYRVWISEVMLQQTQVSTVIGYFTRWMARFPDVGDLAQASVDEVLAHWSGLGYYARARNIKRAADLWVQRFAAGAPNCIPDWLALPGVGPSTAAAIMAQAYGARAAILDGNVKRVLSRLDAVAAPIDSAAAIRQLQARAEALLPHTRLSDYTQALMDLGATLCTPRDPDCARCPVRDICQAERLGLTRQIPRKGKAPKRSARDLRFLILEQSGEIALQTRANGGIWGGLQCFPEAAADQDPKESIATRYGLEVKSLRSLPAFVHVLTHLDLHIEPLVCDVAGAHLDLKWYAPERARELGLPKPVRSLIDTLYPTIFNLEP